MPSRVPKETLLMHDTVTDVTLSEPGYDVHDTKSTADRTIYVDLVA